MKRFRHLLWALETHCQEQDDENGEAAMQDPREQWPGLGGLAWYLVQTHLSDKDSTVRLWAAATCLELLAVFAPEVPWDTPELKLVWSEVLHQMATLTSSLTAAAGDKNHQLHHPNRKFLTRMLQLIAHVQMGALLKELVDDEAEEAFKDSDDGHNNNNKNGSLTNDKDKKDRIVSSSPSCSNDEDREESSSKSSNSSLPPKPIATIPAPVTAIELLSQFVSSILHAIRASSSFQEDIVQAVTAILQEYRGDPQGGNNEATVPIAVLDELMLALLPGPTLKVPKYSTTKRGEPPVWHKVDNPVYRVSAQVLQTNASIVQNPLSALLRQLLAKAFYGGTGGEHQDVLLESVIATEPPADSSSNNNGDRNHHDTSIYSIVPLVYQISASSSSGTSSSHHTLLETRVFGMLQEGL